VLIGLDILTIGLLIWSFSSLIFDKWSKSHAVSTGSYTADPFNGIEMWLAVTIGWVSLLSSLRRDADSGSACHIILLVFDFVDCFSRRATGSSKRPIEISLPRLIPSNRGYGSGRVGDVEWG
jgi:hypothetical protein